MRCDVLTAVNMSMLVFWVVTPCRLLGRYQRFGKHTVPIFRVKVPKRWYLPTSPRDVTIQKTNIDIYFNLLFNIDIRPTSKWIKLVTLKQVMWRSGSNAINIKDRDDCGGE
jgi:hypothetical protein